jgi:hypothetical protein
VLKLYGRAPCGGPPLLTTLFLHCGEGQRPTHSASQASNSRESGSNLERHPNPISNTHHAITRPTRLTGRGSTSALRIASAGLQIDRMRNLLSRWRELQHAGTACAHALLTDQLLAE